MTGDWLAQVQARSERGLVPTISRPEFDRLLACAEALAELVALKDGPRDEHYRATKEAAWERARVALGHNDTEAN